MNELLERWDSVPFVLDETWQSMEALSISCFSSLDGLKSKFKDSLHPWNKNITLLAPEVDIGIAQCGSQSSLKTLKEQITLSHGNDSNLVVIELGNSEFEQKNPSIETHTAVKALVNDLPSSVFISGSVDKTRMFFFFRPLVLSDFGVLWSANPNKESGMAL